MVHVIEFIGNKKVDSYDIYEEDVEEFVNMYKEVLPPLESMSFNEWVDYLGNELTDYIKEREACTLEVPL